MCHHLAHVAGSAAAYASFSEFRRQGSGKAQRPYRGLGFSKLEAQNQIQVDDRAATPPAELRAAFAGDWLVEGIAPASFELPPGNPVAAAPAWLATIRRA